MLLSLIQEILKQREQQYGQILGESLSPDNSSELLAEIKEAITVLAKNQQRLYQKLEEIENKLEK